MFNSNACLLLSLITVQQHYKFVLYVVIAQQLNMKFLQLIHRLELNMLVSVAGDCSAATHACYVVGDFSAAMYARLCS